MAIPNDMEEIHALRHFNRYYTQRISVLSPLHDADLTLADNRVLYELANPPGESTASAIGKRLDMDAGYLSRVLRKLESKGYARREQSPRDGRTTLLSLTDEGWTEYRALQERTNAEIGNMLAPLCAERREQLMQAMKTIESILDPVTAPVPATASAPTSPPAKRAKLSGTNGTEPKPEVELRDLRTGAGDLGWILSAHSELYWKEKGWNEEFERIVAKIVADFRPSDRERAWIATVNGERAGCIFLVASPGDRNFAKIRVLLVTPQARGCGLASRLVDACVSFARERGYAGIELETEAGLGPARRLYGSRGFNKVGEERSVAPNAFGVDEFVSEKWELVF
ncbi:bifunctional MarR family transcriptional regulator, N-acetyltransferase [Trichosporon asahii var. asahii CBS 8904]|uniref:Bifunctional MarR family transcriptional regulator, N-acetyltransferase n=2 Tax=Trichosporon asahii var. asahii TaxID=189963 RepID=K1VJD2_TRIAC|nr:bifunctional MarR family transcriptional regulator, N-acetyltransferase [Trichosporon asahii var. asahii CBS 2479]EJT52859.1 bifunctional MarR family transcriptional regulator, N-acetyltransferase [Trichosporon asahii var. asahii CBS 2479]EKD00881.1 bifunctional MarR family transcriptional regulator, N-acetyltransferase [Trichosporon asahii var. asahii CBS 8904]